MNVTTPTAAPMAFYVPSHNTLYAWAKQQNGEWVPGRRKSTRPACV